MRTLVLTFVLLAAPAFSAQLPIQTTAEDFKQPGTQPNSINTEIIYSTGCTTCHANYDADEEPYRPWNASMMAQSARDPIFHACLAIAEQDAAFSGELCIRCHAPGAWLAGRSTPTDGSGLIEALGDFDGITCNLCHRMVDPIYSNENPAVDQNILAGILNGPGGMIPTDPHSGQFVIDPEDRRRGPYDLGSFFFHQWEESPFHRESLMCASCHDVSNPVYSKSSTGDYVLNNLDEQHPTHLKGDEFPIERTYSEWSQSEYAIRPVDTEGLFGGNQPEVSSCQDCHMPKTEGYGCRPDFGFSIRTDLGRHHFNGANSWVLEAVRSLYPDTETGLDDESVTAANARNLAMMQSAADLEAFYQGSGTSGELVVRVVNQTGHKLPTGYHEGRMMWLNVVFRDANGNTIEELGAYDMSTATLTESNTTVFEAKHGLDASVAAASGLPQGVGFHFVLNNKVFKDNRIPPRGYTEENFEAIQAAPVGTHYPEHHYWHDSSFTPPAGATSAVVSLYHQTTSREYIEFLRDENTTNNAGQIAYDQWVLHGKSEPVLMDQTTTFFSSGACPTPRIFGVGKTTFAGLEPKLRPLNAPSVSGGNFTLTFENIPQNQPLLGFWSYTSNDQPLFGGTLLLKQPVYRMSVAFANSNGEASIPVPLTSSAVGEERYYQAWFRDPQEPIHGVGLTNGAHVNICP